MKLLSLLLTAALLVLANKLAADLKHANALPANKSPEPRWNRAASVPGADLSPGRGVEFKPSVN